MKPLNGRPLVHRDVSAALGECKEPPPKPPTHLSAKQQYEQRMKHSFPIESISGINLNGVAPRAAKPKLLLDEFLADSETFPALLRNVADRIDEIRAPAGVAAQQDRLVAELRSYGDLLDTVRADARRDGLDEQAWAADRRVLGPRLAAATAALTRTVGGFQKRGYSIYVKPSGD